MSDQIDVVDLLDDLRSVKLAAKSREYVESAYRIFKERDLPSSVVIELRRIARRYGRKISELHASRDAARASIWRVKNGISIESARKLVKKRISEERSAKSDLGI